MKKIYLVSLLIILGLITGWIIKNKPIANNINIKVLSNSQNLSVSPTIFLTPTPTLPVINKDTNLEEELLKYSPQDFTPDYKNLTQEIEKL